MKRFLIFALILLSLFFTNKQLRTSTNWSDFIDSEGNSWRGRLTDRNTISSIYGISKQRASSPEKAVDDFLQKHFRLLGIDNLSHLRFLYRRDSHFVYQQYFNNLPVDSAVVSIHLNRSNQIIAANSSFVSGLKSASGTIRPYNTSVSRLFNHQKTTKAAELVILPMAGEARPAWKLHVDSLHRQHGSWLLYIDALRPNFILRAIKTHTPVTGEGRVYLENPVVTPDRSVQQFLYLHGNKLNGKFLKTLNANDRHDVNEFRFSDFTTATNAQLEFNFRENDLRLAEAMAYFHINRVHDQWKKFGMNVLDSKAPVFVNVTEEDGGKGLDNAFYSRHSSFPNTGVYVFGSGERLENLGLDADVYYHEYGHGVLDQSRPQFLEAFESNYPRSFHEGFGDISAVSITGNSKIGEFGLRIKESQHFVGRNLENSNRFPQDVIHPELKRTEIHYAGLIAGGSWWDLQKSIGSETAQEILYKALPIIPKEMTFFDLRDSMLVTDSVLNQGANQQAIEDAFSRHGITGKDPGQIGKLTVTRLRSALFDINTGSLRLKQNLHAGDIVAVLAEYQAEKVTPGYNMIPEQIEFAGPPSQQFFVFLFAGEAVKGRHGGLNGALQALIETPTNASKGTYTVTIRTRLGGTSKLGPEHKATFTLN